jgi:hypothetical protein
MYAPRMICGNDASRPVDRSLVAARLTWRSLTRESGDNPPLPRVLRRVRVVQVVLTEWGRKSRLMHAEANALPCRLPSYQIASPPITSLNVFLVSSSTPPSLISRRCEAEADNR